MTETKIWNFLLPGSGCHQLVVQDIGTDKQKVCINDVWQTFDGPCMKFEGPAESMIELRMGAIWSCLVNGVVVEDGQNPALARARARTLCFHDTLLHDVVARSH